MKRILILLSLLLLSSCSSPKLPYIKIPQGISGIGEHKINDSSDVDSTTPVEIENPAQINSESKSTIKQNENSDTAETIPSTEYGSTETLPPVQTQSPPVSESYNPSAVSPSKPEKDISNLPEESSTEPPKETDQPVVTDNHTEPTESPKSETQPKPSIDINTYIEYVLACIEDRELTYDAGTTACWNNPIIVGTNDAIVKRDINHLLDWYQIQGFTRFAVWAEERTDGKYDLYIGYA